MKADTFNKFAIGFGAIATGLGGLGLIEDWLKKQQSRDEKNKSLEEEHKSLVERWNKQYSQENYLKTYRVIQSDAAPGVLYIQDLPDGPKHWIANPDTLRDLDLDYSQAEQISNEDFKKIPSAGNINTKITPPSY